ncbi:hypothetical protein ACP70R_026649 [Stipagrostis hirtigluma subsp. patula]
MAPPPNQLMLAPELSRPGSVGRAEICPTSWQTRSNPVQILPRPCPPGAASNSSSFVPEQYFICPSSRFPFPQPFYMPAGVGVSGAGSQYAVPAGVGEQYAVPPAALQYAFTGGGHQYPVATAGPRFAVPASSTSYAALASASGGAMPASHIFVQPGNFYSSSGSFSGNLIWDSGASHSPPGTFGGFQSLLRDVSAPTLLNPTDADGRDGSLQCEKVANLPSSPITADAERSEAEVFLTNLVNRKKKARRVPADENVSPVSAPVSISEHVQLGVGGSVGYDAEVESSDDEEEDCSIGDPGEEPIAGGVSGQELGVNVEDLDDGDPEDCSDSDEEEEAEHDVTDQYSDIEESDLLPASLSGGVVGDSDGGTDAVDSDSGDEHEEEVDYEIVQPTGAGYKKRKRTRKGETAPDYRNPRGMGAIEIAMRKAASRKTKFMFEPVKGMVFDSRAEAYQFYNLFSWEVGFGIRYGNSSRNRGNKYRTRQELVCEKQGYDKRCSGSSKRDRCPAMIRLHRTEDHGWYVSHYVLEHNHPLSESCGEKREWNSHSKIEQSTKDMIKYFRENNVTLSRVHCILGSMFGSMDDIPFSQKTLRGVCAQLAKEGREDDWQKTLNVFRKMRSEDPGFQFSVDFDRRNRIKTLLWTSGKSRSQYSFFGDVVTFDTTYCTNL